MIKILFFIPDLSVGGAEKVLVNLVNNMSRDKYDITVQTLFAGGVNEQFLKDDIKYKYCFKKVFRGNSQILKMLSPEKLYKKFIKEHYDIIVSYLEGTAARIVAGCNDKSTKLVSWIHGQQDNIQKASYAFKNADEAKKCYEKFDNTVCVSEFVKNDFKSIFDFKGHIDVLYNTNETEDILRMSDEKLNIEFDKSKVNICVVGKITKQKGCDRIVHIQKKLIDDGFNTQIYFLGTGPDEQFVEEYIENNKIKNSVKMLGYQTNPYKYVKNCDLFVCGSHGEGFSTAATEALIVGTPVVTVDVSGMKEMLGKNNEYGIVTENSEEALYEGIKTMLTTNGMIQGYTEKAIERGQAFSTDKTVKAVEDMFERL